MEEGHINVGIGFATGRKSFRKVLRTNVFNWKESGLTKNENVHLNLFVAYDLKYSNTKSIDYTNIGQDMLDLINRTYFIGSTAIRREIDWLTKENVINEKEAQLLFGSGYAAKRNAVLYTAIKNKMDYLVFLDDDEYPLAVTKTRDIAVWSGQPVLDIHLQHIGQADITNGHHCGYISPIPYIEFDDVMSEQDLRLFIEALSNDIISWDTIRSVMRNGGVTYADTRILVCNDPEEVQQINHAKFISGANLCINLTDTSRVLPFYNPPGARGEDTFLGTCLAEHKVLRVPCYTFHDGFSTYQHLMDGVLPISLEYIRADSESIKTRFYHACIGWIRYKPLLLYITQREDYEQKIEETREKIDAVLPKICTYFKRPDFMNIKKELRSYSKNVEKHYQQFLATQQIWRKLCKFLIEY